MSERSIVITQENGSYQIHSSLLNEYELLGLFEQIVFDLKRSKPAALKSKLSASVPAAEPAATAENPPAQTAAEATVEKTEKPPEPAARIRGVTTAQAADLRTRIGNAIKAIRDLDGRVENINLNKMSDEEMQIELEELTEQYKRLKKSKGR